MTNDEPNRSLLWPAVLVGIGVAGSLDEIVLHQLLRWHHFNDRGSQAAGLIAGGIFHLASTAALVIGLVLLVQRWRTGGDPLRQAVTGILLGPAASTCMTASSSTSCSGSTKSGAGALNNLPYDLVLIGVAAVVSFVGLLRLRTAGSPSAGGRQNRS